MGGIVKRRQTLEYTTWTIRKIAWNSDNLNFQLGLGLKKFVGLVVNKSGCWIKIILGQPPAQSVHKSFSTSNEIWYRPMYTEVNE